MAVNLKDLIDIDLLAYFKSKLDLLFAGKVDKVDGKGLSTNDYTADEKAKLSGIATGAQVNTIEGIQVVGNSVTPANKIVNIPAATQSAPGVMTAEDKTKLDGVAAGSQANVIESVKVNGTPLTVTNKAVDVSVPTAVTDLTDADDYATKDYVDTNGGKIDKIKVNGVEQTISAADKSVDLDIDDIAWFDAVITTSALGATTINPTNVTLTNISSAIAAGKYPVMVASYTDSTGPGDYDLYMPLTQFYPERTNEVIPVQGDIVVFEGQLGDKHYILKYTYDSIRYRWTTDITSFAHKGDAEGMVHYLNFVETDTTAGDGFLVTAKDDEGNDISAAGMATNVKTYYNSGKAVYAKIVLIDGTTMTIPFGSVSGNDLYFYSFDAISGVGRVLYYISNDFAWYIQYVSHSEEIDDIYTALEGKVDVVDGKGLSTEDYTTAEKTKLAGIATGAQVNVIESVKVNGTALAVTNKAVNVTVPTKTSELDNDKGYLTGYIVNYTLGETNSCDKSYNDIISAAATGKTGCVRIYEESPSGQIDYIGQTTNVLAGPNGELIIILAVGYDSLFIIKHTSNNVITSELNNGTMSDAINDLNAAVLNLGDTVSNLSVAVDNKVDKEDGKGLSTNDYTTEEKEKLANAASMADVDGLIAERIPTRVSELENDAGYLAGHIITYNYTGNGITCNEDFSYISGALSSREPIIVFGAKQNQYFANCMCSSFDSNGAILHVLTSGPSTFVVIRHDQNDIITLTEYDNFPIGSIIEGSDSPVTSDAVYQELQDYVTDTELQGTMSTVNAAIGQKADASSVYTKTEIDQKLVGAMNYMGTKATTAALPSSGNAQGDVWHVTADGSEWAWNGSAWEELGTVIDLSGYVESSDLGLATNADIDELFT